MTKLRVTSRWLPLITGVGLLIGLPLAGATTVGEVLDWARPSVMTLKEVSDMSPLLTQPNLFSNLDCEVLSYRLTGSSEMQSGCFSTTAFGLFDSDSNVVIFNGTDEGLPLIGYSPHQVLAPWPGALDLVSLSAADTGGSYIGLYRNPLGALRDDHGDSGQLIDKRLSRPPDLQLTDPAGQPLVISAQTLAFSAGGGWLVAEDLSGSFVRINLATLDMVAFAPSDSRAGFPALPKSQVAVSGDGRYVAIESNDQDYFRVYDLASCVGSQLNLQPEACQSYDYWSFIGSRISNLGTIRRLRFVNNGLLSFEMLDHDLADTYELAPTDNISSLISYLGLGDSYSSGEGAFDYLLGTDTGDNHCHQSAHSYPLLLSSQLFTDGGHSVACSGAIINDIGDQSDNYVGQARGSPPPSMQTNFLPGYLAQRQFVDWYQPRIVTVSVGGNDIGFGDIVRRCVEPHLGLSSTANTCYSSYEGRQELVDLIDRTKPRLSALYEQLEAEAPLSQLYVIGYPQIAVAGGDCALNVHLNAAELQFASELIDYMNMAVQQAATAAGTQYVDISQALSGHRLCEAASYDVAMNGLTAGTDSGPPGLKVFGSESYHPNAFGQALIEQTVLRQTDNFRGVLAASGGRGAGAQTLLDAPKTGRPINILVPDDSLTNGWLEHGGSTPLSVSGLKDGLQPNSSYVVRLDGAIGLVIATVTSNADGSISSVVTIPDNTLPGEHTIDVIGLNQAGESVDINQPAYVPASQTDSDGDGISDAKDRCPGAPDSGVDADQDGIDDACDPLIGSSRATGDQNGTGQGTTVYPMSSGGGLGGVLGMNSFAALPSNPLIQDKKRTKNVRLILASPDTDSSSATATGLNPPKIPWSPIVLSVAAAWLSLKWLESHINRRSGVTKTSSFQLQ